MADKAEDLIGHYLADLFETGDDEEQAKSGVTGANLGTAAPSNSETNPSKPGSMAPPVPDYPRQDEPLAPRAKSSPPPAAASTLDEPARQQLQLLLDSAWQTKPACLEAEPEVVVAPAEVIPVALPSAITHPAAPDVNPEIQAGAAIEAVPYSLPATVILSGKPAWAQKTFESLIIDVAGLKLAIPLIVLGQIVQVADGFSHLPGQGPLFLGTLHTPRGTLRVINTALLVMPERYDAGFVGSVQFVVSLAGEIENSTHWQLALGVSRVAQPVSLACDDVVWRGERSKRPWLLGTVKSQMCALLDVAVIGQMFNPKNLS